MFCFNCNHFFPAKDVLSMADTTGEEIRCCPICGANDIAESETCEICGKEHLEGEIYEEICLDCAWKSIDYKTALQYMEGRDLLGEFILSDWFEGGTIDRTGDKLNGFLRETFLRQQAEDILFDRTEFLDRCKDFCMPYYRTHVKQFGPEGMDFVNWLSQWRRKNADM